VKSGVEVCDHRISGLTQVWRPSFGFDHSQNRQLDSNQEWETLVLSRSLNLSLLLHDNETVPLEPAQLILQNYLILSQTSNKMAPPAIFKTPTPEAISNIASDLKMVQVLYSIPVASMC
jgi:hypothetical protein